MNWNTINHRNVIYTSLASDRVPWMNLADSMWSQDNIYKVVFTGKRNIKDDGENIIYWLWIDWQIFPFADKINKLPKKRKYVSSDKEKNTWTKRIFIYPHGTWKDNIWSVILDWRQRSACHSSEGKRPVGHSSRSVIPTPPSRVCPLAVALLHKKGPRHRRKICANSLWLYSFYIQSLTIVNKLNWIITYNCLNSLKWKCFWQLNCVLMLNWTVFNRTDYLHKNGFGVK